MFTLAIDYSMLSNNFHVIAFFLGAVVYYGYQMLPTLRLIVQGFVQGREAADPDCSTSQPTTAEPCRLRSRLTRRNLAGAGSILFLCIGLALTAHNPFVEKVDPTCPLDVEGSYLSEPATINVQSSQPAPASTLQATGAAPASPEEEAALRIKMRSGFSSKFMGGGRAAASAPTEVALPSVLLAQAHALDTSSGVSAAWPVLEACAAWKPAEGLASASRSELQAQLECNGELLQSGAITQEASHGLLWRARQLMASLRTQEEAAPVASEKAEVEWARITHGVFQLNCKAVADELQMSRKAKGQQKPSVATPLEALRALKRLEAPYRESLTSLAAAVKVLEPHSLNSNETAAELQEIHSFLGADRACALQALQEGRSVSMALPKNAPMVKRALQCNPRMLENFQAFVLREAAEAKDAATIFGLGLYYSDIGLAAENGKQHAPLFGAGASTGVSWTSEPAWLADAGGSHAPSDLVQAEAMMLAGEEASEGADRGDRGAARALRLYQHAKMLALKHHDTAAEWRYRTAAELAAGHRRQKLAAHALGRLAYFLSLRGRKEEALEVAGVALTHGEEDPLAQFLQVSLRRSLGELKSDSEVETAEKQLAAVAGKMPSKTLEDQRASAHAELGWWGKVATEGLQVCLRAWDAAQMLICFLSGVMFGLPGGPAAIAAPAAAIAAL